MNNPFCNVQTGMDTSIHILALHEHGKILPETYEAVSFARDLGGSHETIVVLGAEPGIHALADELAGRTGLDVHAIASDHLEDYCAEAYRNAIEQLLRGCGRFMLCIPHTARGYDVAPGLAAALDAACITAIEGMEEGSFIRSVFSGKIKAHVRPETPSAVLTVLPGAWHTFAGDSSSSPKVTVVSADKKPVFTTWRGMKDSLREEISFADADVIVSAGRGIGRPENLALIRELAALFSKSAIGATRAVCDLGWLGYSHQIGSTGTTVSPRVYIACGISGAFQHMAGIRNPGMIIAVNTDPHAAIFSRASYCIAEDIITFIPILIEEYTCHAP